MDGDKSFLVCEFNKNQDGTYRSPYSTSDSQHNDALLTFESHANEVWEAYVQLYYGREALGSVHVKEAPGGGVLVACFLVKKSVEHDERLPEGEWNSAHMVHVGNAKAGSAKYKISSTVTISMYPSNATNVSATVSRDTEQVHPAADLPSHLENIGKMIESIEIDLRSSLENVLIPKTREVASGLRQQQQRGGFRPSGGIPIMMARPKKKSGPPAGAVAMPGMGGAHAAALNAAVLKRAPKK